jgi:hypothetical protein
MERMIETVASGIGNGVGWMAESGVLFGILLIMPCDRPEPVDAGVPIDRWFRP